ncbi:glucosamine-6-phosphate deaminase [Vagococcus teuberi]|uniref:Glucosamine-6-phosphate deaminase n=1 Tax=Vagococcus teuberi TaxID=519472 RepID=A0A1J0A697_9ENTE|nr:glucosamine-6-phosphate deaminase [Vagococcus teuberi]APB31439.1 glucosamine-6-phosphate deaminase [Vagococcus teuberi]
MKVIKVTDQFEGAKVAFDMIQEAMKQDIKTLGLATGSTPEALYKEMVESDVDFSHMTSVNLDEYVGLGADDPQSYHYFMREHLFNKKPFKETFLPNGLATDAKKECERYDAILESHPIDIQILGIGENGHIGFNEPGSSFDGKTSEVNLTESTIEANSRNFSDISEVPTKAYSMGIGSIMQANKIILLAYGTKKAEAIYQTIKGPITELVPASALQVHPDVTIIVDEEAGSKL